MTTDNVIIESCEAKNGGAIYAKDSSEITLTNTQIKGCAAIVAGEGRGGAIYCKESSLTLDHTIIGGSVPADGNKARRGGGIYFEGGSKECTIPAGCTIQYNKATYESGVGSGGGGVYVQSGTLTSGGTISNNEALFSSGYDAFVSGGGVFVGATGKFIMNGGIISGNKAKWGGGVYIHADTHAGAGSFTMEGGTISGCHAGGSSYSSAKGGGVCIKAYGANKGSFTMKGGTITGCTAEVNTANEAAGGGVYADVETVFKMSGSAAITPSTDSNTLTKSFNDVYLHDIPASGGSLHHKKAVIIVTGALANNPVAKLTMRNDYDFPVTSGYHWRNVVEGEDTPGSYPLSNADVLKFEVTPQITQPSPLTLKNWKIVKVGNAGQLQPDP